MRLRALRLLTLVIVLAAFGAASSALRAQAPGDAEPEVLYERITALYKAGKYAEAVTLAEQAAATGKTLHGENSPQYAIALSNLAMLLKETGRPAEAEPYYRTALAILEKHYGPEHPDVAWALGNLALLLQDTNRLDEAEPLLRRALATGERVFGPEHPSTIRHVNDLAQLLQSMNRLQEAEPLMRRVLEAGDRTLGPDHPETATSLNNLAAVMQAQGRVADAIPLLERALAVQERASGGSRPQLLSALKQLGLAHFSIEQYSKAEVLFRRRLDISENSLGAEHPETANALNELGSLYQAQGRYRDAEPLQRRALEVMQRIFPGDHPDLAAAMNNLGTLYDRLENYAEAERRLTQALAIRERVLGPEQPGTISTRSNLANIFYKMGRLKEARAGYTWCLAARKKIFPSSHPIIAATLNNMALAAIADKDYGEAETLLSQAIGIETAYFGEQSPRLASRYNNLGWAYMAQSKWSEALAVFRRASSIYVTRMEADSNFQARDGENHGEEPAIRVGDVFQNHIQAAFRTAKAGENQFDSLLRETFILGQRAKGSQTAAALSQMAVRTAREDSALAGIARERQDLVREWQNKDRQLLAAKSRAPAERDQKAEGEQGARLTEIDARIAAIDARLTREFPDYAALVHPAPLSVEEVQEQLRDDEALLLFLDVPEWKPLAEETFIWLVTKTGARWERSPMGTAALAREVQALRCGMDATSWYGHGWQKCRELTGGEPEKDAGGNIVTATLPFSHARAHKLYKTLAGQAAAFIKGKQLLIVPSGPLTQLPFQVLLTTPPATGEHRSANWLIRDHALTVLPAVSSLKALRRVARPSAAAAPMIGFGNPLLDGPDSRYAGLAHRARASQHCRGAVRQQAASLSRLHGIPQVETRGGLADVSLLRKAPPLPETADELCAVARGLHADPDEIRLGARATEGEVKRLSASGQLARYRMVHFATHGALAGQINRNAEPGLLLTPPDAPSEEDDGYLSASEIAALKLDADWVILSACNTAAGDATGAEALSGLARAFFYAQARALLVSHWEVDSSATVKLITSTAGAMARDHNVGRAEALRRAMLALVSKGAKHEAHPAYWAPFVVVGEGNVVR